MRYYTISTKAVLPVVFLIAFNSSSFAGEHSSEYTLCMRNAVDHTSKTMCLLNEKTLVLTELNTLYSRALAEAQREETSLKDAGTASYDGMTKALEASQESFEKYKTDTCHYRTLAYGSGNAAGDAGISCEIDLMQERIKMLKGG